MSSCGSSDLPNPGCPGAPNLLAGPCERVLQAWPRTNWEYLRDCFTAQCPNLQWRATKRAYVQFMLVKAMRETDDYPLLAPSAAVEEVWSLHCRETADYREFASIVLRYQWWQRKVYSGYCYDVSRAIMRLYGF